MADLNDYPKEAPSGVDMKLVVGAVAAGVVLAVIAGHFLLGGEEEAPPAPALSARPEPAPPAPAPVEEPRAVRAAEPEEPPEKPLAPPPRAAEEPAADESMLVAGFEEEGYAFECGTGASAEQLREGAARGDGVLRLFKREGSGGAETFAKVTFPAPVDLSGHNKLGLWLRSSGAGNEFKLALITSGRQGFVPAAQETVFGKEWAWYEFFLAGERSAVEGLVLYFSQRAEPAAYRVYLDEVRAYEKATPVAAAPEAAREPPALPKAVSAARPNERKVCEYDFDGGKPSEWDLGERVAPGRGGAGGCLKSAVHGGEFRRLRLRFKPRPRVQSGMVAFFACRLEGCTSFWIQCYDESRKKNVMKKLGGVTPGEWRTVLVRFTDLVFSEGEGRCEAGDEVHSFSLFAGGSRPDRAIYIDDFVIAVEEARLVVADFEEGLGKATSKYGHAIIDSTEAARVGKKGLVITVKPGDNRTTASRVEFPVAESDLGRFTHVSVWLGGEGFARLKGMLAAKTRGGSYERIETFRYGPGWKRYVFELKDVPMSNVELLAFYFSNGDDWPESFKVHLDELALHVGPPGPEGPAPRAEPAAASAEAKVPAAGLDLTGGGEILLAHDFENGEGPFLEGEITSTNTYRSSRASYKAKVDLKRKYESGSIGISKWSVGRKKDKGIFEAKKDTVLAFAYYIDGGDSLTLQGWVPAKKKNFSIAFGKLRQGAWNLIQVRFLDFHVHPSGAKNLEAGDWIEQLNWLAGRPGQQSTFMIDDVVICNGRIPGDIGKTLKRKFDKKRETVADPRKDGFYMTTEMVDALAERLKEGGAKKKTLAVLGDRLAASNYFLASLAKTGNRLDPKKGYRFIPKAALAQTGRRLSQYRKRDMLKKALERYKPEVVAVLAGHSDLKKGLPAEDAGTEYAYICECCLEAGAVPVIITVPVRAGLQSQLGGLALGYNEAAFKAAKVLGVPMIDAHSRLNAEGKSPRKYFSSTGLRQPAYDEINSLFVEVYDRLEKYVFARGE